MVERRWCALRMGRSVALVYISIWVDFVCFNTWFNIIDQIARIMSRLSRTSVDLFDCCYTVDGDVTLHQNKYSA